MVYVHIQPDTVPIPCQLYSEKTVIKDIKRPDFLLEVYTVRFNIKFLFYDGNIFFVASFLQDLTLIRLKADFQITVCAYHSTHSLLQIIYITILKNIYLGIVILKCIPVKFPLNIYSTLILGDGLVHPLFTGRNF